MKNSLYAKSFDGRNIAYRVYGKGKPTVVLSNGIGCHQVFLDYLIGDLSKHCKVIVWDYPGHTDSDKPADPRLWTLGNCTKDMLAILEDSGTERAVFGGFSMGVQVSLEFAARHPEKTEGLIALCGAYKYPLKTFFHIGPILSPVFPSLFALLRQIPQTSQTIWKILFYGPWAFPVAKIAMVNRKRIKRSDFDLFRPHFASIDLIAFLQILSYLNEHSAENVLPAIKVPTLIVAGAKDNFTPLKLNEEMHSLVPGSELYMLPEGTHGSLIEFPELINPRVIQFIHKHFA